MGVSYILFKLESPQKDSLPIENFPVQDSPATPPTPDIQGDLSLQSAQPCLSIRRSTVGRLEFGVRDLDIVIPSSVDQARSFLSAQSFQVKYPIRRSNSQQLPPRFPRKHLDPFSTPLSSRTSPLAMICHGCHGHIGGGAHIGSVPGKNHCKFQHSLTCPGGISEDHDWAPCPVGYVPGGMSASGFENTLQHSDFGPMHSSTGIQNQGASQPNFSTPLLAAQVSDQAAGTPHSNGVHNTITPHLNPLALPHHVPLGGQGHQDLLTSQLTQGSAQHLPLHGHVQQDLPTPEQVQGSGLQDGADWDQRLRPRQGINYSEDVAIDLSTADRGQAQAADLRAANQAANQDAANLNSGQDFPFTINDLRGDPLRQNNVAMAIHQIRRDLPSLAAAQSAPPQLIFPQAYSHVCSLHHIILRVNNCLVCSLWLHSFEKGQHSTNSQEMG